MMFETIGDHITSKIRERSRVQGHTLTGKFEAGLGYEIRRDGDNFTIVGLDESGVGKYLDKFLPASKVPYSPGSGASKSLFIDGLKRYAEQRFGLSGKEAMSAAFAMATKMKKEGKPTYGSMQYSGNGSRTGVITDTLEEESDTIGEMIRMEAGRQAVIEFTNLIRKYKWQ